MRRITHHASRIALCLLLAFGSLGFERCPPRQSQTAARKLANNADRVAKGISQGLALTDELFNAGQMTGPQATTITNALLRVNSTDRALVNELRKYLVTDPATDIQSLVIPPSGKAQVNALLASFRDGINALVGSGAIGIVNAGTQAKYQFLITLLAEVLRELTSFVGA